MVLAFVSPFSEGSCVSLLDPTWSPTRLHAALKAPSRGNPTVDAVMYIETNVNTGTRPSLLIGDDRNRYWAKWPGNPHGNMSLAHEWVVARLGAQLGAPVAPGVLLFVDEELLGDTYVDGDRLPGGVWFGSRLVSGVESQVLDNARRDGNPDRIPRFLALWALCLGCDAQFMYAKADDDQIWSIDHGLWFGSHEGDWTEQWLLECIASSWDLPDWHGSRAVRDAAYQEAAEAVEGITSADLGEIVGNVPVEWGIPDQSLEALASFVHGRREAVADQLRVQAARRGRRRT